MKKRIVSFLMCLVMAFSIVPAAAWAEMLPAAQSTADSGGNAADVYANGEDTAARRRAAARNSGPWPKSTARGTPRCRKYWTR